MSRIFAILLLAACDRSPTWSDVEDDAWCPTDYEEARELYEDAVCRWQEACIENGSYHGCRTAFASQVWYEEWCFDGCAMRTCLRELDSESCHWVSECSYYANNPDGCASCDSCTP